MARIAKGSGALTAAEFNRTIKAFPKLSERAKAVARAVLVEGQAPSEVAQELGCSKQLAYAWSTKVYAACIPAGWVTETVTLPAELMADVRKMQADARAELEASLPAPRVIRR